MEENQELKFICKFCNKKYPCGKSLGGHMRSHVIADSEEKLEPNMKKISSLLNGGGKFSKKESDFEQLGGQHPGSYGLRENPKKTWRAVDQKFSPPHEKACKQCGKVFQSLKALCGHMACHSEKERGGTKDDSWSSENQKLVMDTDSDTEVEDRKLRGKSKTKRYKKIVVKSSSSVSEIDEQDQEEVAICLMMLSRDSCNRGGVNSVVESSDNNSVVLETKSSSIDMRIAKREALYSSVYNVDDTPKSMKVGNRKLNSSGLDAEIVQSENSDSGYFLGEAAKAESDVSVDGIRRNAAYWECKKSKPGGGAKYKDYAAETSKRSRIKGYKTELIKESGVDHGGIALNSGKYESKKRVNKFFDDDELVAESYRRIKYGSADAEVSNNEHKRSKYECFNCKKSFKSYQALGGHRPCHKKTNAGLHSWYNTGDCSSDSDDVAPREQASKIGQSSKQKATDKEVSKKSEKKIRSKKQKGHMCPFCDRVFKSGQALGGHKRSHFLGGNEENGNQSPVSKPEVHDLFDLNLPAPAEDEDDGN